MAGGKEIAVDRVPPYPSADGGGAASGIQVAGNLINTEILFSVQFIY